MVIPNNIVFEEVEACVARGQEITIPFKGRSMEPFLRQGDRITLEPLKGRVRRGDVVLFRHEGQHILHRVVGRRRGSVVLQGDACRSRERVAPEAVVARLKAAQPWRRDWHRLRLRLAPYYFLALFILMWGYFGGLPLDNFVFGIRLDHLLHASLYLPCSWFIMRRRPWIAGCGVALLTESVQYLLPYRGFDVNDLAANMMGVILGALALKLFLRSK